MSTQQDKEIEWYKVIPLPHLRLNIYLADMSKLVLQGAEVKGSCYTTMIDSSPHEVKMAIFIQDIEETLSHLENTPHIAHELTHILQFICVQYSMDAQTEQEHLAYIMSYLLEEIFNVKNR